MKKSIVSFMILVAAMPSLFAQRSDDFQKYRQQMHKDFNDFKQKTQEEYDAFRKQMNEDYANFMRNAWKPYQSHEAEKPKEEKTLPPVVYKEPAPAPAPKPQPKPQGETKPAPDNKPTPDVKPQGETKPVPDVKPQPKPQGETKPQPKQDTKPQEQTAPPTNPKPAQIPVQKDVVVVPPPAPAPEPIAPVKPKEDTPTKKVSVSYYGTLLTLPFPANETLKLKALNENALADAWQQLSKPAYDATVKYALSMRSSKKLCDWAYLDALRHITEKQYGKTNEAVLAQAFLMSQSGYRIRMAMGNGKLHLLIASNYFIYNMSYFLLGDTRFYLIDGCQDQRMQICEAKFDNEKSLAMQIGQLPLFGMEATPARKMTSDKGLTATASVNKNLLDFFSAYPTSQVVNNFTSRWAAYANTPIEQAVKDQLYPPLKKAIEGKDELAAVNLLLNWVQTAFVYGYDDKVWGHDRAFFAQETLYYPYSDCEDRAILFSRLVRDLTGLEVVLLYYPNHLAAAVHFNTDVKGDYLTYNNRKFTVCDPTFINANVGKTMPDFRNVQAKIIVLGK